MKIEIPELSCVVLVGASGSGKSSFARKHFLPTEIISSDTCRGLISDDENNQIATSAAFGLVHFTLDQRLKFGRLSVVDATNVQEGGRREIIRIAKQNHVLSVAIVFDLPEEVCHERNAVRPDRNFGPHVVRHQSRDLRRSIRNLRREGFTKVHVFKTLEEVGAAFIERHPMWNNRKELTGPFDIIGDVHGCFDELSDLLSELGYQREGFSVKPPEGRMAVFVGDLVDRGPNSPDVVKLVRQMVLDQAALCVPGNHDIKLVRYLKGGDVKVSHGLEQTLAQLESESDESKLQMREFLDKLVSHVVLDGGKLVVAHAGLREEMHGRGSAAVRDFALYGETSGEIDEFGLPVRLKWAEDYRGAALVVFGHTPVPQAEFLNNTVCIDTGCVFGGSLTAFRYPERELVSVPAREVHYEPVRPFLPESADEPGLSLQQQQDETLDVSDVRGRMYILVEDFGTVIIPEENSSAALEAMSRFAADPRWAVYLPPTMSPSSTSSRPGFLEHPEDAFAYFAESEVAKVVCEEKHMGSRAVVIVGRDESAIWMRFGIRGGLGTILSRTGRHFFDDKTIEQGLLERLSTAMERAGTWDQLGSNWAILDAELLPWSAKAQQLLRTQYAPVGLAATANLTASAEWLRAAANRLGDEDIRRAAEHTSGRLDAANRYVAAYRGYCWPVNSLEDFKLAPFHIMASEGAVHYQRDHAWHMETLHAVAAEDPGVLRATPWRVVDPSNPEEVEAACEWWMTHTSTGGEGMVVKPLGFSVRGPKGFVQPALKSRGPEYLRIIYGPEYLQPENLERLRRRALGPKRKLAQREFALGIEGLRRFVRGEPLRRVHQCAFGVLALESEPVDPRL